MIKYSLKIEKIKTALQDTLVYF